MPPHDAYLEPYLGSGAVLRAKRPAARNVGLDLDPRALDYFKQKCPTDLLPAVELHQADALQFLPTVSFKGRELVYFDPPYPMPTRSCQEPLYRFEMTEAQHLELLRLLKGLNCYVIVSSYWSEMYGDELASWRTVQFQTVKSSGATATEWLWLNYSEPSELHDYRYIGKDFSDREDIRNQKRRLITKLATMPPVRRNAILNGVVEHFSGTTYRQLRMVDQIADPPSSIVRQTDVVKDQASAAAAPSRLALSLFPGIDLFGRGFEAEGFTVVRGPDKVWGGDIEAFHPPPGVFNLIFGGSPCQEFSAERRGRAVTGYGVRMLEQFARCVYEAQPDCWLLENVPAVPDLRIDGYHVQRFGLTAVECGGKQQRLRHFQFGSKAGWILRPERLPKRKAEAKAVLATDHKRERRREFGDVCELQGLPRDFYLEGFGRQLNYELVGNGVPVMVARTLARAVRALLDNPNPVTIFDAKVCLCGCGEIPAGAKVLATDACRWRAKKRRDGQLEVVNWPSQI